jgi:hypothetical protein
MHLNISNEDEFNISKRIVCCRRSNSLMFLQLKVVDRQSPEADMAKTALFSKHPEMEGWPKNHNFEIFKLDIEHIFLIDWFGGPKPISPSEYLEYGRNQGSLMSF